MLVVGRRVIPLLLHYVAHTGSRELFRLAVLAVALGVAFGAAELFGVSFALGAFFAGMVLERIRAQPAGRRGVPAAARCLRGAVLRLRRHAVRPGDPGAAIRCRCSATVLIIVRRQVVVAFAIVLAFGHPSRPRSRSRRASPRSASSRSSSPVSACARLFWAEGARPHPRGASILSILFKPVAVRRSRTGLKALADAGKARAARTRAASMLERTAGPTPLTDHDVLVGYGRVGSIVGEAIARTR